MIREIDAAEVAPALDLLGEAVGAGWYAAADLRPAPGRRVCVAPGAAGLDGVAMARLAPLRRWLERQHPAIAAAVAGWASAPELDRPTVHLDVAAVAPRARGRGLYGALVDDRIAWGAAAGGATAVAIGWSPPGGCRSEGPLLRAGFRRLAGVEGAYLAGSLAAGATCPACGRPCRCAGLVLVRRLPAAAEGSRGRRRSGPG